MPEDRLKKLRAYYRSLAGHRQIIERLEGPNMEGSAVPVLAAELARFSAEFPELVPSPPNLQQFHSHQAGSGAHYYRQAGILASLAMILGRLEVEIEQSEPAPVVQSREFAFIRDRALQTILERDYREIQTAFVAKCWKSVIVLSGGALEAILLDLVLGKEPQAKASAKAPKEPDVRRWDLSQLIEVSVDLKLIAPYALSVSDATRAYRNLVHPGNELRTGLTFSAEEARIALTVLDMIRRDLSK